MATAPLFVANLATLKAQLRLSGLDATADSASMLNRAILTVRLNFMRHLGAARVTEIVALAFSESPVSENEITRAVANVTETDWVRYELMAVLPTLFQDSSGSAQDIWNHEAPFRRQGQSDIARMREELMSEIEQNLIQLAGDESLGEEDSIAQGGVIDPEEDPPQPFGSIFPVVGRARIFGETVT